MLTKTLTERQVKIIRGTLERQIGFSKMAKDVLPTERADIETNAMILAANEKYLSELAELVTIFST